VSLRVGIDVGGTKAQGVALGPEGEVVGQQVRPTPRGANSLEPLIDTLVDLASDLGALGSLGSSDSRSTLGIGVPGLVTRAGLMSERLGYVVAVDNDATCATVAEWQLGAARGAENMVLVTLGTGIGGGLVTNGAVQRGMNGFAGEFGHMVIHPDGPRCPCGRRGCWERFASGSGLAMLAREAATGHRLQAVVEHAGGDPQNVRGEHVMAAALDGDAEALAVIDEFGRWVALGLVNLTNALDPEMFVLGGGLAVGSELYLGPITRWYRELLYQPHLRPLPRIEFAKWGPLAGAVGAALLPGLP
jgi:glucokinase